MTGSPFIIPGCNIVVSFYIHYQSLFYKISALFTEKKPPEMRMSSLSVKRCQTVQSVHTLVLDAISLLLDFFSTVISTVTTLFK